MNTLEDRAEQGTSQAQNQGAYLHDSVCAATAPSAVAPGRVDFATQPPLHPLSRTLSLSRPPLGLMLSEPCLDLAGPWRLVPLENHLKSIVQENKTSLEL